MKNTAYLLPLFLIALNGCGPKASEEQQTIDTVTRVENGILLSPLQLQAAGILFEPLEERVGNHTIKASGIFDVPVQYTASVAPFVGGFVKSANKHVGEHVTKGQVLLVIEGPELIDLQQQYLENKSQLPLLESEYERQADLSADSITSRKAFEGARAALERTRAVVDALRQKLQYAHINFDRLDSGIIARSFAVVAPISGYLTKVDARIGAYAAPGQSLMEIVDLSHLHVELAVYESDALKVKKGQKMRVWLPSETSRVYEAEIYLVDKEFDRESRTMMVHGHFEEDHQFAVGMYVDGEIVVGENQGFDVPASAAVFSDQKRYVFLAKESEEGTSFMAIELEQGSEAGNRIILPRSSVPSGYTRVVSSGAGYLLGEWTKVE